MQTDLPVPDGQAHAQPAQDLGASEALVDVDELDGVRTPGGIHLVGVVLVVLLVGALGRRRALGLLVDDRDPRARLVGCFPPLAVAV
jgi:hypothetical protein